MDLVTLPPAGVRDRVPGFAVALGTAGAAVCGLDAFGVRPPLRDVDQPLTPTSATS